MTAVPLKELTLPSAENPLGKLPSLYLARLMSPTEVAHALRDREPAERKTMHGRWMLCGDVSSTMFSRVRKHPEGVMFRVSGFKSTTPHLPYAVLTHQLEELQHRFLLPLHEKSVADCLASLRGSENLDFMLGNNEGSDAIVLLGTVPAAHYRPLLSMCIDSEGHSAGGLLAELTKATAALATPTAISSLDSRFEVNDVSMSVLLPVSLQEELAAAAAGREH